MRGSTQHSLRLVMQLPVTSRLTSGDFSDAEANFIGVVRRHTLIRALTRSCFVSLVKFELIRMIGVKQYEMEGSCGREERRGEERRGEERCK